MLSQSQITTTEGPQTLTNTSLLSAPFCTQKPAKLETSSSPRLYVTFKVLQLVTSLRKRVKTHVPVSACKRQRDSNKTADQFCLEAERVAFEEIDCYLGRKTSRPNTSACWDRLGKKKSPKPETISCKTFDRLLDTVDQSVKAEQEALTVVAASDRLFLQRSCDFKVQPLSSDELIQLLVIVSELLDTLRKPALSLGSKKTEGESDEVANPKRDWTYIANLEHLLLCLKQQLLQLLVARLVKVVRQFLIEWHQRDERKYGDNWFFEFPDARHPLSTTWPWSIRPSLAVLWGVCWMFYPYKPQGFQYPPVFQLNQMDYSDDQAETMQMDQYVQNVPQQRQQQQRLQLQTRRLSGQYQYQNYMGNDNEGLASGIYSADSHMTNEAVLNFAPSPQNPRSPMGQFDNSGLSRVAEHEATNNMGAHTHAHTFQDYGDTNNPYSTVAAPSVYANFSDNAGNWQPQSGFSTSQAFQTSPSFDTADTQDDLQRPYQQYPAVPEPQQQLSTRHFHNPTIDYSNSARLPQQQRVPSVQAPDTSSPAHQGYSPYNISSPALSSSGSPQDLTVPRHHPHIYSDRLRPEDIPLMNPEQKEMQTPPRSPHDAVALAEQLSSLIQPQPQLQSRKRSISDISGGEPPRSTHGSRAGSVHSMHSMHPVGSPPVEEAYSPRHRLPKRGDAPKNAEQKYICTFAEECQDLTFDRKCEWSKHMDKHDRPYHCDQPQCAKLQGFTYSGGLLRHEREVHGKHGGPKSQLMCPYPECKRATGKGFTRKENLNEHIRRVHADKHPPIQTDGLKHDGIEALASAAQEEIALIPITRVAEAAMMVNSHHEDDNISPALKRKRYDTDLSELNGSEDIDDMKEEIRRLRAENAMKDERLQKMEQAEVRKEQEVRQLMDSLQQLKQATQQFEQQQQQQIVPAPQMQTAS